MTTARSWRGSATVFTGVARGLAGRGHAVHAFVAHPALEDGFRARGIPVTRLAIGDTGLAEAWRLRRALRGIHAAVALVDKARADDPPYLLDYKRLNIRARRPA